MSDHRERLRSLGVVIREWEHEGIECFIAHAFRGVVGYVKPGRPLDEDLRFPAPGGITFDDGTWLGFDTGHGFDTWLDPDLPPNPMFEGVEEIRAEFEAALAAVTMGMGNAAADAPIWTLEKMCDAVEELATFVAAHTRVQ